MPLPPPVIKIVLLVSFINKPLSPWLTSAIFISCFREFSPANRRNRSSGPALPPNCAVIPAPAPRHARLEPWFECGRTGCVVSAETDPQTPDAGGADTRTSLEIVDDGT